MAKDKTGYGARAGAYLKRGWAPIPVTGKFPPVAGATGEHGTVTPEKIAGWISTHPAHNLALRATDWVALDVDHYGDKRGGDTLAEYVARLGRLPATWSSTARGEGPSRQYFFRVPEGTRLVTKIGADIEVVQHRHRYSVVAPSVHPDTGQPYRWWTPAGVLADRLPELDELPDLPDAWLTELQRAPEQPLLSGVNVLPWRQLLDGFALGGPCREAATYADAIARAERDAGHVGHDDAVKLALRGFMLGREGHAGLPALLTELHGKFAEHVKATPHRDGREPDQVFRAAADTAQRKAVTVECRCATEAVTVLPIAAGEQPARVQVLDEKGRLLPIASSRAFLAQHPVKRYTGSTGATYVCTDGRWRLADLRVLTYTWLAERVGERITGRLADELLRAVITYSTEVGVDDEDASHISFANGLLNVDTGELRPHAAEVFVTAHSPVAWKPGAQLGRFADWLSSTFEPEQVPHVLEVIGYALAPRHDLKVALAFHGAGGGGKSTLVNLLTSLVGTQATSNIAPAALGDRFNRAALVGKRLNAAGDVGTETLRNLGILKSIIAADAISAEFKGRDGFTFRPNAFNVASFNALPAAESNDSGFWDRWLVLTFRKRFVQPTGPSDNYWRDVMPYDPAVLEGVAVAAVQALRRLRARGGFDRQAFLAGTTAWRMEVDGVAAFAEEHLTVDGSGYVKGKGMHDLYVRTETEAGGHPRKRTTFYRELLAYLDERYPGAVHRENVYGGTSVGFVGLRVIHRPEDTGTLWGALADPDALYGPKGWARGSVGAAGPAASGAQVADLLAYRRA